MNEFQKHLKVGDRGVNRVGSYMVLGFEGDGMWVCYDNNHVAFLSDWPVQQRIMENMGHDQKAFSKRQKYDGGYAADEVDIDKLVRDAQRLIVPELRRREKEKAGYPWNTLGQALNTSIGHHHVYVILLSKLSREERSGHKPGRPAMPCVYVGQTWHAPAHRFRQHKNGELSSRYVKRWGMALLPEVYTPYNPMSEGMAKPTEAALADALHLIGCTVFGGH